MSNEIYNEKLGFFSDDKVSDNEKAGLTALLLGGTYETRISQDGSQKSFVSLITYRGGKMPTPVMFTYGTPSSQSRNACLTMLKDTGLDKVFPDLKKITDGSLSDEEVVKGISDYYNSITNIDKTKYAENFNTRILPKLKSYFENLKNSDKYLADNPKILDSIMDTCVKANGGNDKKKQMTEAE